MSADSLVFDMSSQSEGSPSVFVRKDWLSILDNQNQNYQGNQSVIDTSQLANSNKYMNYREAYLMCPLLLTLSGTGTANAGADTYFQPATQGRSADFVMGLKNWYGSVIHSFTLDYNGTTIIQQTPYIGLWNTFKLMTSMSFDDLLTQSSQLGFYPDSPLSWTLCGNAANVSGQSGIGVCNNNNAQAPIVVSGALASGKSHNEGLLQRQLAWAYDPAAITGTDLQAQPFSNLLPAASATQIWKSYINNKVSQAANGGYGYIQISISAIIYLKHVASFFERVPLLKGVFMKLTINLNQSSVAFDVVTAANALGVANVAVAANTGVATIAATAVALTPGMVFATAGPVYVAIISQLTGPQYGVGTYITDYINAAAIAAADVNVLAGAPVRTFANVVPTSPLGGVQPIMIASALARPGNMSASAYALPAGNFIASLSVGNRLQNSTQIANIGVQSGPLSGSVILNVPAYTFNPVFESSYLSSPVKKIVYTDVYQYQIVNTIKPSQNFNNLISNGIANIKSVLVMPFLTGAGAAGGITNSWAYSPLLSPFDPAGGGPTSPLCLFNQFNVQISGQNAIYNTERYSYEQFQNQLYGTNAVNGGMTDGMTSGLIDSKAFESEYCYYYVDCGRMLPVEEAVPKSVNILGLSMNALPIDVFVFVCYGVEVSLDILTGARV